MKNTLLYKNYIGSIEYSEEDRLLCGKVLGIKSLVLYDGETISELIESFHSAVDDYLEVCALSGINPEIPFKGNMNIRLKPETHRKAAIYAINNYISLNSLIETSVEDYLASRAAM